MPATSRQSNEVNRGVRRKCGVRAEQRATRIISAFKRSLPAAIYPDVRRDSVITFSSHMIGSTHDPSSRARNLNFVLQGISVPQELVKLNAKVTIVQFDS